MARAKKIKTTEEVKHEEVEGQTTLAFVDEEPAQTEEVEEVLTGKDFPHQQKGKGGRPVSPYKKIQMKLYVTNSLKIDMELKGERFGKTASQFIECVMSKFSDMSDKELGEFLGLELVSEEKRKKVRQRQESRSSLALRIKDTKLNLLRKHQFSQGKFSPAEILEAFAYVNLNLVDETEKEKIFNSKFSNLMEEKKFRLEEVRRVDKMILNLIEDLAISNKKYNFEITPHLWQIENFYCENITDLKINSKAKKMTVSDQNGLLKLLLGE